MIDRSHALPMTRQCQILSLTRSTACYRPQQAVERTRRSCAGSMNYTCNIHLLGTGCSGRTAERMAIEAVYKKPGTSRRRPAYAVYPYLLRHRDISRPNRIFAANITRMPSANSGYL